VKIVFVTWRDTPHPRAGGAEVLIDRLARGLQGRGHDVAVLCGGPVDTHSYRAVANGGTYSQYLTAPLRYARHFRDADLVVDTINGMPFFSPLWRRKPRLALVTHVHTDQWKQYFPAPVATVARWVESRGMREVYRKTHIATISPSTKREVSALGIDPSRVHVMWLGAEVETPRGGETTLPERSPEPFFVALGRLAANKRLDLLLDMWRRVQPKTGGRLAILGDGPDRPLLERRIAEDPVLSASVVLEGHVSEHRKAMLLSEAWLLVHAADREGWGLVIPEAGLFGTPSLAFDAPGVRDAIEDGVSGVLVTDEDAFVDAWVELADDREQRERLGRGAAARAAGLSWERTVDEFLVAADAAIADHDTRAEPTRGIRRSVHLISLFRREATDPDRFYHYLARDTLRELRQHQDPAGVVAVDIGGGPGYIAEALKQAGAECTVVEYSAAEMRLHNRTPDRAVQGDGQALPLREGSVRLVHSSNVLEHVPDWQAMLSEMVRVLAPGDGLGYLTFTNWYSPWGGHETSPWHYFGGDRAAARYTQRYGQRPKNEYGTSLYRLHISEVLRWFAQRSDVEVVLVAPRYLPEWMRWIERVPALREVVTWNLVVVFRKREAGAPRSLEAVG
jgi:glycosyltransferase involved in cell wall biosynthesis/ubiquinone/menaquinone biosynthesis C-methylase UbiE